MGVVLIKWAWLKILRALRARLYLRPHHSKNPRSAPEEDIVGREISVKYGRSLAVEIVRTQYVSHHEGWSS